MKTLAAHAWLSVVLLALTACGGTETGGDEIGATERGVATGMAAMSPPAPDNCGSKPNRFSCHDCCQARYGYATSAYYACYDRACVGKP